MLEEITIENLGIIKKAHLPFAPGMNCLLGETGTGKSLVLNGLHLLLGKRGDSSMVLEGSAFSSAEGIWSLDKEFDRSLLEEAGAAVEDDELIVNRTVKEDGKSRAVMGGKTVPLATLASVGSNLVRIHSQSDQLRLKDSLAQLEALDTYGAALIYPAFTVYREAYNTWKSHTANLKDLRENQGRRQRDYEDLLEFVKAYEALSPEEGELDALEQEVETLLHMDSIRDGVQRANGVFDPDMQEGVTVGEAFDMSVGALRKVESHDKEIADLVALGEAAVAAFEVYQEAIERYGNSIDEDVLARLYQAQERLQELQTFEKRQRLTLEEAALKYGDSQDRLAILNPEANSVEELEERVAEALSLLKAAAETLSAARQASALALEEEINLELSGLAMGSAVFSVEFIEKPFTSKGNQEINFLLANGKSRPRPIAKAASGGELSRIMLALEVVLADPTETPTFVFDEVDSGIGGETAVEVGKRLAKLASTAQVIVVTHLPQVAAYADRALKVMKATDEEGNVETSVDLLDEEAHLRELTRMLSGLTASESGLAHAQELRSKALEDKNNLSD